MDAQFESDINQLKRNFAERAKHFDEIPEFPYENFHQIVQMRLHTLPLPSNFGGRDMGIESICNVLMTLSSACPSTGLCLAMHYYSLGGFKSIFSSTMQEKVFLDIWENGKFMASISNPNILFLNKKDDIKRNIHLHCRRVDNGFIVNGSKKYVSAAPLIKYLPIYCFQENCSSNYNITALLATMDIQGVSIEETWNYSGMRATMTHNVNFNDVFIPLDQKIGREGYGIEDTQNLVYWFRLALSSVYLGIAKAAYEYIINLVKSQLDPITNKMIALLPGVQFSIAEMRIKIETAISQLIMCAKQADEEVKINKFSDDLYIKTLVTKQYISRVANEIVFEAMQIQGTSSMIRGNFLERLYRDVRAATFHPPSEDLLKEVIAKKTLGIIPLRNRWV